MYIGTFRGCSSGPGHVNENISSKEYWDFSVNDHAFTDLAAFINKIKDIKTEEGVEEPLISVVAHSVCYILKLIKDGRYVCVDVCCPLPCI